LRIKRLNIELGITRCDFSGIAIQINNSDFCLIFFWHTGEKQDIQTDDKKFCRKAKIFHFANDFICQEPAAMKVKITPKKTSEQIVFSVFYDYLLRHQTKYDSLHLSYRHIV